MYINILLYICTCRVLCIHTVLAHAYILYMRVQLIAIIYIIYIIHVHNMPIDGHATICTCPALKIHVHACEPLKHQYYYYMYCLQHISDTKYAKPNIMKSTIRKWVLNVMTGPNPTNIPNR